LGRKRSVRDIASQSRGGTATSVWLSRRKGLDAGNVHEIRTQPLEEEPTTAVEKIQVGGEGGERGLHGREGKPT